MLGHSLLVKKCCNIDTFQLGIVQINQKMKGNECTDTTMVKPVPL